ncbi:MAG TPA: alkaline shock response membrane anchor protein AmaP [Symbiobacteriaceae bacterium]|nr:alkaline shock response membrane anchor protein AmaP [Symbiobacteriaceae bacterium]
MLKFVDRIVLSMYTLALAALSGLMIVVAIAPERVQPQRWLEESLATTGGRWWIGLVGALFFGVSMRLIYVAAKRSGGGQPVIHETGLGVVAISLDAVENLVRKTARSIKGVREIRAIVTHRKDGLGVHLTATISPEVSIPQVSEEIQTSVRQYVKRVVGVELADVRIQVENIANESRRTRLD